MIISHLIGGLGNQMFQHALGRSISLSRNVPLRLDLRDFADYTLHNGYELNRVFGIDTEQADKAELTRVLGLRAGTRIRRLLMRKQLAAFRGRHFIMEQNLTYWPGISAVPDDCYLLGNWQSEKYFQQFRNEILADFSFNQPLTGLNLTFAVTIKSCNAVSLHVRRGDFASNPGTLAVHGLCSLEYYRRAIDYVSSRVENPQFFIFSNDIPWAKDNLQISSPCHYVTHNSAKDGHQDMRLMSLCRHHIIANSSFSWWGAWLNSSTEKLVIAPDKWFAIDLDSSDIVPSSWIRMRG